MPQIFSLDPLTDPRWERLADGRDDASIFHSLGWLDALRRTYGYKPVAFTTCPPAAELKEGFLFCEISTWLSGRRLVSIPFSDHAALLGDDPETVQLVLGYLKAKVDKNAYKYVEIRPTIETNQRAAGLNKSETFFWHTLDLQGDLDAVYRSFHKNCVQRAIRRAERENLAYHEGRSKELIHQFYHLLLLTHKRHGVPPQPISWFWNLGECLGNRFKVRIALKNDLPIAGIVTLDHKSSMVYKYGASDAKYHHLGGMAFLMWKAIQDAKTSGLVELDLGRSDCENAGLITFKEHWGAERQALAYWGFPAKLRPDPRRWPIAAVRKVFSMLPISVLPATGRLLYRHIG